VSQSKSAVEEEKEMFLLFCRKTLPFVVHLNPQFFQIFHLTTDLPGGAQM
jgi:hypothetical protein